MASPVASNARPSMNPLRRSSKIIPHSNKEAPVRGESFRISPRTNEVATDDKVGVRVRQSIRKSLASNLKLKYFNNKINSLRQQHQSRRKKRVRFDESRNEVHDWKQKEWSPEYPSDLWYTRQEIESSEKQKIIVDGIIAGSGAQKQFNKFSTVLSHIYVSCHGHNCKNKIEALVKDLVEFLSEFSCQDEYLGLESQVLPGFAMQSQNRRDQMLSLIQNGHRSAGNGIPSQSINGPAHLFSHILAKAYEKANLLSESADRKLGICLCAHH